MTIKKTLKERINSIKEFCPAIKGLIIDETDVEFLEEQIEELKKIRDKLALKNKKKIKEK